MRLIPFDSFIVGPVHCTEEMGSLTGSIESPLQFLSRLDCIEEVSLGFPKARATISLPQQTLFNIYSFPVLCTFLAGVTRLFFQLLKPLCLICVVLSAIACFFYEGLWPYLLPANMVVCTLILYTLSHDLVNLHELGLAYHRVAPGVYYDKTSPITCQIVKSVSFLNGTRPYRATPWLVNGDVRTIFPFMCYQQEKHHYVRRWVKVDEHEAVAIDISFPRRTQPHSASYSSTNTLDDEPDLSNRYHDPSQPVALLLHGLNGGSDEKYIADFVTNAHGTGMTVVVMIARGMMGSPVTHSCFSGARSSDAHSVVHVLHAALGNLPSAALTAASLRGRRIPLAKAFSADVMSVNSRPQWRSGLTMVGFSMGAIVTAKYVTAMGSRAGVSCAVAFCGAADVWRNGSQEHSGHVWQPALTFELKRRLLYPNQSLFQEGVAVRHLHLDALARASAIPAFDASFTAPFHGYKDVLDYYRDQSCTTQDRLVQLQTLLLLVSAQDDPVLNIDTIASAARAAAEGESPMLIVSVTSRGGHVAWPEGWAPWRGKFSYMSQQAIEFARYVHSLLHVKSIHSEG